MAKKVYFAGSIRGGRDDASIYREIIEHIQKTCVVLTEHVGREDYHVDEIGLLDEAIYHQDMAWLIESDLVIAECTHPSLGVGYELAYAEKLGKPCYIFYRNDETVLSAMLTGNPYFVIYKYKEKEVLFKIIDEILK